MQQSQGRGTKALKYFPSNANTQRDGQMHFQPHTKAAKGQAP